MSLLGRPHQGRGAAQLLDRVDVDARLDEQSEGCRVAVPRREHHQRFAVGADLLRVGAGLQEAGNDRRVTIDGSHLDRGDALTVGLIRCRSGSEELIGQLGILMVDRPVERRGAVHLSSVDVGLAGYQRPDGGDVMSLGRIRNITRACGGAGTSQRDGKKKDEKGRKSCTHN